MALVNLNRPENFLGPKLFLADMDATMIVGECMDEMAEAFGLGEQISATTARAMAGELDFEASLEQRLGLLKGLTEAQLTAVADGLEFQPGAKQLVQALKGLGCRTVLVSGGFTFFADRVAQALGFDRAVANRLEMADGALTGAALKPYVNSSTKVEVMAEEMAALGIDARSVIAIGDGANDIPMLTKAGWGVAFEGKPAVRAAVTSHLGTAEEGGGDHAVLAEALLAG